MTRLQYTKYFFIFLFMTVLICFILYGVRQDSYETVSYTDTREAIGTIVTITLYDTEAHPFTKDELKTITDELFEEADRLEHIFSAKLDDSELSLLNSSAFNNELSVSSELFDIFDISLNYCYLSNGGFDISLGKLISLWNIGSENPYLPSDTELSPLINKNGWKHIILNKENQTISYNSNNFSVDLGAIAKGYIGDKLKELAKNKGIECAMFSLGGNIITIGERYTGGNWTIGITNPFSPDSVIGTLKTSDMSVVTSGDYERYFTKDGIRYHHILDGSTGYPCSSGIVSCTIIGASSAHCDALSTSCFALGVTDGLNLIENIDGYEALLIDDDGNIHTSSGMDKYNFTTN